MLPLQKLAADFPSFTPYHDKLEWLSLSVFSSSVLYFTEKAKSGILYEAPLELAPNLAANLRLGWK
jgi:hypothetical protein